MDNKELHYLTYDDEEIWNEMIVNYVNAGGDLLYPGDEKEMLLRSVLADFMQVFAGVDNALRMKTLRYAVGDYLDLIGELRNCYRIEAAQAAATVTITTNATGVEEKIDAGTPMTADGSLYYLTKEDIYLTGQQATISAVVIAEQAGVSGNGLLSGTQLQLVTANDAVYSIYAASDATGGNNRESDDAYRERIRLFGINSITTGPAVQYEAIARSVSSTILDAKAVYGGPGNVNVYLALSFDEPSPQSIKTAVKDALSDRDTRPLTDRVYVILANNIPYTLNVECTINNTSVSTSTLEAAIDEYQEWQDSTVGLAFNPDRLKALLYQAGASLVEFGEGSNFNGDTVEYTPISYEDRCMGTITLTIESE